MTIIDRPLAETPVSPGTPPARITPAAQAEESEFDPRIHHLIGMPRPMPGVRGALRGPKFMHHNRLAVGIGVANLVLFALALQAGWWTGIAGDGVIALESIATVATANFTIGILFRQQHVINAIFLSATKAPTSWPLWVRALLGKVYHVFGGVHIGAVVSGTAWFFVLLGSLFVARAGDVSTVSALTLGIAIATSVLLVVIIACATPRMRVRHHDLFERTHRFGGWTVLGLFWLLVVSTLRDATADGADGSLTGSPLFWMLLVVTVSIALPWLKLRRVDVDIVSPSDHVSLVRFDYGVTPFAGSSTTVSRSPILEWHSFANVPSPSESGFRLTISRAGDWTGQLIDDQPEKLWVKGVPTAGVGNVDRLFKKVVWVATGSGIGPTLPHLLSGDTPSRLIWATRNPRKTYGDELVDDILAVQPEAVIWDTDAYGKPDLVRLAWHVVQETGAEAVICIANKPLTWKVVEGMERVGIPAFGAIFDS